MGAGLNQQRKYRLTYNELKKIQRELFRANIDSTYKDREIKGEGFRVFFTFVGPASNGEVMGAPVLVLGDETYGGFHWAPNSRSAGSFQKGLDLLKQRASPAVAATEAPPS
jgi:hypothetical protein